MNETENEIWKLFDSEFDDYMVSNMGRLKSLKFGNERIMKLSLTKKGYSRVCLNQNKHIKHLKIHRAVAIAFIENPDNKIEVNHIDGNKQNNHVSNLEWVTAKENMIHAFTTGLKKPNISLNEHHGMCKLSNENVLNIRNEYKSGNYTQYELAIKYNCSRPMISHIVNNKNRKL